MKIIHLAKNTYRVDIREDGSLLISLDNINSIMYAGSIITSVGGIEALLNKCEEIDISFEEYIGEEKLRKMIADESAKRQKKITNEEYKKIAAEEIEKEERLYNELLSQGIIPCTYENVRLLLFHLNRQNMGSWSLPKMDVGYSCNQYDCDGKIAVTISLDKDLIYEGENLGNKFVVGAPRGHLTKYRSIR